MKTTKGFAFIGAGYQLPQDSAAAAAHWGEARRRFPDFQDGYIMGCRCLDTLGRHAEAEAVIADAVSRFPDQIAVLMQSAYVATFHGRHEVAVARWEAAVACQPDNREACDKLAVARSHIAVPAIDREKHPHADLLSRFESLGDGCEFGLVQRNFGAEPLGLLRWAGIPPWALIDSLNDDLAAFGRESEYRLSTVQSEVLSQCSRRTLFDAYPNLHG